MCSNKYHLAGASEDVQYMTGDAKKKLEQNIAYPNIVVADQHTRVEPAAPSDTQPRVCGSIAYLYSASCSIVHKYKGIGS